MNPLTLLIALAFGMRATAAPSSAVHPTAPDLRLPGDVQQLWGQYAPYFPVAPYPPPPRGCHITQVNILQRHGARFPTANAGTAIKAAVAKLQNASRIVDPKLAFIKKFTYDLGAADLVPYGAAQSFDAGQQHFARYADLFGPGQIPFVRASSAPRVVASAANWTAGFAAASRHIYKPIVDVVLNESANDTLEDGLCPNAGDPDAQTDAWLAVFAPPITKRLNTGAPGANLSDTDTFNLMSLCAFETVAHEKASPFCNLFSAAEWAQYEYMGDLDKFYGTGYGQPLGRVQGVGYVNELLARLTGTPVHDATQTNRTLDASPATFPLHRPLYADFSHDDELSAIYAALGLFRPRTPLDPRRPDPARVWRASRLVPFAGRMAVERLACGGAPRVRILVDDALQPLEFCGARGDGVCTLDAFVASQAYARSNGAGDFEKCFA